MAKQHNTQHKFKFFNKRELPKDAATLKGRLIDEAVSCYLKAVPDVPFDGWVNRWNELGEKVDTASDDYSKRYWVNTLAKAFSDNLWCEIFNKLGKGKPANKAADQAIQQFETKFR